MRNIVYILLLQLLIMNPLRAQAPALSPLEKNEQLYRDVLEIRVQIFRIDRDKIYEMHQPGFNLVQEDLAEAIGILEEKLSALESQLHLAEAQNQLEQAVKLWDNLRFHALAKLDNKTFARFFYDTKTFDSFLEIMLNKMEDKFGFKSEKYENLRANYEAIRNLYIMNVGYMTDKYPVNKSFEKLFYQNKSALSGYLEQIKNRKSFSNEKTARYLAKALNEWKFLRYNMANGFIPAEKTVFASVNNMHFYLRHIVTG